jgi:Dyp-type peroxidase family
MYTDDQAPVTTPAPTLDFDNIQGDILEGLPKKFQSFYFFAITNPIEFRKRLQQIIPLITTTTQALADTAAIQKHKSFGNINLLNIVGTNIAFSHTGLNTLGITDDLNDQFFTAGQLADASNNFANQGLSDPGVVTGTKTDPAWDPAFKQNTIHGCFLITGDSKLTILERFLEIEAILAGTVKDLIIVDGNVRPGAEAGHEHFGFQDGISQPPIIGFREPNTGEIATAPGIILIGEPGDTTSRPAWAKDSSFLVFRKLRQFVPEFNHFLSQNPIKDPGLTPAQGSELLGARLVGRWKSGAPIDRDPTADNLDDADDPNKVDDFDYSDDPTGLRCPMAAHLRKMNPRNGAVVPLAAVQQRRIIRQGIAYGPEVDIVEAHSAKTIHDRGLLFTCYQSNIGLGFHFLQNTWADNPNFPRTNDGFDAIIGQNVNDPRSITGTDPQNLTASLSLPKQDFVVPLGGEYFLSPSLSALKTTFAA